jgi:hypothetical protein
MSSLEGFRTPASVHPLAPAPGRHPKTLNELPRSGVRARRSGSARLGASLGNLFKPVNPQSRSRRNGAATADICRPGFVLRARADGDAEIMPSPGPANRPPIGEIRGIWGRTSMTTNYDSIAEQYKRASQQPWRAPVEAHTLMKLIGDPAAKVVIDVACGEGFYTGISAGAMRHIAFSSVRSCA